VSHTNTTVIEECILFVYEFLPDALCVIYHISLVLCSFTKDNSIVMILITLHKSLCTVPDILPHISQNFHHKKKVSNESRLWDCYCKSSV